jgi:hypothetical protein
MKNNPKTSYTVINRTIYEYYNERLREFRSLKYKYKKCIEIEIRRTIRKRMAELVRILDAAQASFKAKLMYTLDVTYAELKNYPELVDVKRKQEYLKHSLWQQR